MAAVHQLIVQYGIEEARRQAVTKHERLVVEAAHQVLSDDAEKIGFTYSGFAITSLPHKEHKSNVWRREGHNLTMLLRSGIDQNGKEIGVPYGSCARFILLFLQGEAIRTKSREIELGRSMHLWLTSMGMSVGGKTYRLVSEQAKRISTCNITFYADRVGQTIRNQGGFVKSSISMSVNFDEKQPSLWQDRVLLDDDFYRALSEHPVPVSETALRAIGPRSLVLDVYVWLSYRLHSLEKSMPVGWISLLAQFGAGYKNIRQFRFDFKKALEMAVGVYPDARVSVDENGIVLHPSRPPVAKILRI